MIDFEEFWHLHAPMPEYIHMRNFCKKIWESLPPEKQDLVYRSIQEKKQKNLFVDFNPYYAIQKNAAGPSPPQSLSYADYYRRYGTTEETDGWHRKFIPDEQRTIYVK